MDSDILSYEDLLTPIFLVRYIISMAGLGMTGIH